MNPMDPSSPVDIQSIMADPAKMNELAMNFDPNPILKELGGSVSAQGQFTPQIPQSGPQSLNGGYTQMLGNVDSSQMPSAPSGAPLDPRSMMMLNSMMPRSTQQAPHASLPGRAQAVNIAMPDMAGMKRQPVPGLGTLIGGR